MFDGIGFRSLFRETESPVSCWSPDRAVLARSYFAVWISLNGNINLGAIGLSRCVERFCYQSANTNWPGRFNLNIDIVLISI
jgi:hypothetical protein